jgi:hypothetical protein
MYNINTVLFGRDRTHPGRAAGTGSTERDTCTCRRDRTVSVDVEEKVCRKKRELAIPVALPGKAKISQIKLGI